ncbi:MAG: hypothetical protein HQL51_03440 [Magnetococcales bacterium]|nr:hypothetical protein [Magnetococcales bacterium]
MSRQKSWIAFLYVGILCFIMFSLFTNFFGIQLMIKNSGSIQVVIGSALGSLGIASFLIYFSFEISSIKNQKLVGGYVVGYVIVAIFSVLFSFNAIYENMIRGEQVEIKSGGVINIVDKLHEGAKSKLKERLDLAKLEALDKKAFMDVEDTNVINGVSKGKEWRKKKEEYEVSRNRLEALERNVNDDYKELDKIYSNAVGIVSKRRGEQNSRVSSSGLRDVFSKYEAFYMSRKIDLAVKKDEIEDQLRGGDSVEYSLSFMVGKISDASRGKVESHELWRIFVAIMFGVLFDAAPLWVSLVARKKRFGGDEIIDDFEDKIKIFVYGEELSGKTVLTALFAYYFSEKRGWTRNFNSQNKLKEAKMLFEWVDRLMKGRFPEKTIVADHFEIDMGFIDTVTKKKYEFQFLEIAGELLTKVGNGGDSGNAVRDWIINSRVIILLAPVVPHNDEYPRVLEFFIDWMIDNEIDVPVSLVYTKWDEVTMQNLDRDEVVGQYKYLEKRVVSMRRHQVVQFSVGDVTIIEGSDGGKSKKVNIDANKGIKQIADWIMKVSCDEGDSQ